ncbi:MAG: hypothetical protein WAR76_03235 [Xanthobacteraceae bacterium]
MTDDPEKNPSAGEDVFEDEHVFILDDGGVVTPVTWNHRVLMTEEDGEKSYCIHEVHYDETGRILGWTKNPIAVCSDTLH